MGRIDIRTPQTGFTGKSKFETRNKSREPKSPKILPILPMSNTTDNSIPPHQMLRPDGEKGEWCWKHAGIDDCLGRLIIWQRRVKYILILAGI
jgi:hypothetical protein